MTLLLVLCSNFCSAEKKKVSYIQIKRKWRVKTDIKAIQIQLKHVSQFQCWHSYCICKAILLILAHLIKVFIDYYIWYECCSRTKKEKRKGCCSSYYWTKSWPPTNRYFSLQIVLPKITSNETQPGMYSVASLWTLILLSIIFTSMEEDALFKTFLSQHAFWDADQFCVSRDQITLWRVRVYQMVVSTCLCV